jgi:hypothetical protein
MIFCQMRFWLKQYVGGINLNFLKVRTLTSSRRRATSKGKIVSSILVELFVMRGDAYMKAGRRAEALADYRRVKSDAWGGSEPSLPRHLYFTERGTRNLELPEPWPPPPPTI